MNQSYLSVYLSLSPTSVFALVCPKAGFYFIRDDQDTGLPGNPLYLPAFPYEIALAIQDRMFKDNGELFYPVFPGDPAYENLITQLDPVVFPGGGPTALAVRFVMRLLADKF
jgi:spore coat protein A, manganese oxidase